MTEEISADQWMTLLHKAIEAKNEDIEGIEKVCRLLMEEKDRQRERADKAEAELNKARARLDRHGSTRRAFMVNPTYPFHEGEHCECVSWLRLCQKTRSREIQRLQRAVKGLRTENRCLKMALVSRSRFDELKLSHEAAEARRDRDAALDGLAQETKKREKAEAEAAALRATIAERDATIRE